MKRTVGVLLLFIAVTGWSLRGIAQTDSVRVMTYNLLNYGNSANRAYIKNPRLATILSFAQPDVLSVNEMFNQASLQDSLLSVLGTGWEKAPFLNPSNQTQVSTLFFKSRLFRLRDYTVISSQLRAIVAYRLQYKDTISAPHDTAELTIIVCHLKASSGFSEEAQRDAEAQTIVSYVSNLPSSRPRNILIAGDLNLYRNTEASYQTLTQSAAGGGPFFDPVNRPGDWNSNPEFADIHTQSPRTTTLGDGGVSGGLDSRFDFILATAPVLQNRNKVYYLPGSYKVIGQDGRHLQKSLIDSPTNTVAPAAVVEALYRHSDHLPVTAGFLIGSTEKFTTSVTSVPSWDVDISVVNPFNNTLTLFLPASLQTQSMTLKLYNGSGAVVYDGLHRMGSRIDIPLTTGLPQGLYILVITGPDGKTTYRKLIHDSER
jgi:endonuclease/exonuclease/phosphatase family metal-dependent hydrolase